MFRNPFLSACMEESSTSQTPNQSQNPRNVSDIRDDIMVRRFQNLGLGDGLGGGAAAGDVNSAGIENRARRNSVQEQRLPGNTNPDEHSIWSFRLFGGRVENGSSSSEPSVSNPHIARTSLFNRVPFPNHDFSEAGPTIDWARVLDALNRPQSMHKERLIYALNGYIVKLMIDPPLYPVFLAYLESCEMGHLHSLLTMDPSEINSFVQVAFCSQGVVSMVKLIRKLKKTYLAFYMTSIFSTRSVEVMTDNYARQAMQACLILFSHEQNEILYEKAIKNCTFLAMHKVGCRSLNDCVSSIYGEQRLKLFVTIADIADILCDDPYGNYVLQNVLKFDFEIVTSRIFLRLRGKFVWLAMRKVGSHTVERCMEMYETWLVSVVGEILSSEEAPRELAQDHFGNYVIQKALRLTKKHGLINLYTSLVHALKPHFAALKRTKGGRNVLGLIKESIIG